MSDNISNNTNKLEELSKMKVNDLKKELKSRGLSTVGNKQELIDRMINHSESSVLDIEDTVLDEDNILDEDDGLEDDFGDSDIDDSKVLGEVAEKDTNLGNGIADKNNEQIVQPKKVTLKRNSVTNLNGDSKPKEEEEKTETIENDEQDRVIKLDDVQTLSQTERIQMRAKKFGGNTVPEDKKLARLIKFGPVTEQKPVTSIDNDKLKQRAERFGETVSKTLHDNEKEDKLKARELRFGTIDKTVLTAIKKRNTGENGGKQKNSRGGRRSFPYKKRY
ncbi:SAP domain-containing ribonucleoprotein [Adelges cooleyi]|uniref:SAP domain-containing ribonucleoprotein n=1 Tax=Adelges cooleyi TaxID=133065 RepID=UPI00218034D6|nr:SAP domain-containing ribonucleoprotein [Adelges cooleyi]XP_050429127.1 SAP domain-containing ribonucleoprotein [Adelges cooleyi]